MIIVHLRTIIITGTEVTADLVAADVPVHAHVRVPAQEEEEQDALLRTSMVQKSVQQGSEQDLRSDRKTVFIPFYIPI